MECKDYFELMNMFIDEEISEYDKNKLIKHIESCENCRQEFKELKEMVNALREEPLSELPVNYHKELMEKINNEANNKVITFKPKKNKNNIYRYFGLVAVFALFVVGGSKAGLFNIKDGKFENMPSNVVSENTNENNETKSPEIIENSELVQNENTTTQQNTDENTITSEDVENNQVMTRNNNIINNNSNTTENTDTTNNTTTDNNTVNENNENETDSQVPSIAKYNDLENTQITPNSVSAYTNPLAKSSDALSIVSVNTNVKLNNENNKEDYDFIINIANEYKCTIIEENDFTKIEVPNESYNKFIEILKSKDFYTIEENKEDLTNSYAELNENLTEIQQKINNNQNSNDILNEASEISEKLNSIDHYKYFSDIYVYK